MEGDNGFLLQKEIQCLPSKAIDYTAILFFFFKAKHVILIYTGIKYKQMCTLYNWRQAD